MTILERLLRHDAWTTRALLQLSSHLTNGDLDREFDIGHRTLRRTFMHIIFNMECWCDLMTGQPQRNHMLSDNSIASLTSRLDIVAEQLLALGKSVDDGGRADEFFIDYLDQPPRKKPLGAGLVHVATHGMHHRAQCLYMMRVLGVKNLIEGDAIGWERVHRGLDDWPGS
jgi:uncharacterized damage-inducible protein DinB